MQQAVDILRQYWGYEKFRPPQDQAIAAALAKKDALVLLPTGGGKSICYQVPVLCGTGIGLIVSPLVALMEDQVHQLQQRNIKAMALTGSMAWDKLMVQLDNCQYGGYRFLYVSPERLQNELFTERLRKLPISLIAVDEAHCISEWGHDFRPSYLNIQQLRHLFTDVPFMALTATATPTVQQDIVTFLQLKQPQLLQASFVRPNLSYRVVYSSDKAGLLTHLLRQTALPSIVYVSSRKACLDVSLLLSRAQITHAVYHGGMALDERQKQMQLWMQEEAQVMVATNAFGMGIDKPNVAQVLHWQLPLTLENYFQEAGRAGRNGQSASATLLVHDADLKRAEHMLASQMLSYELLVAVYQKLCSFLQLPYGEGYLQTFAFSFEAFCIKSQLPAESVYQTLRFLEQQGVLQWVQGNQHDTKLRFVADADTLLAYAANHPNEMAWMHTLMRQYPGIFHYEVAVPLQYWANKLKCSVKQLEAQLTHWQSQGLLQWHAQQLDVRITFLRAREDQYVTAPLKKYLLAYNRAKQAKLEAMLQYARNADRCKSQILLAYFGQTDSPECGICSVCQSPSTPSTAALKSQLLARLASGPLSIATLQKEQPDWIEHYAACIQDLLDDEHIQVGPFNTIQLRT